MRFHVIWLRSVKRASLLGLFLWRLEIGFVPYLCSKGFASRVPLYWAGLELYGLTRAAHDGILTPNPL